MNEDNKNIFPIPMAYMPDGTPAPYVLTTDDAVRFLRLDDNGTKHPKVTLYHYEKEGLLTSVKIGKCKRYLLSDLIEFTERLSQQKENVS